MKAWPTNRSAELAPQAKRAAALSALKAHAISQATEWRDKLCKCCLCEQAKAVLGMPKLAGDWTRFPEGAEL